jgi:hypothetical protein
MAEEGVVAAVHQPGIVEGEVTTDAQELAEAAAWFEEQGTPLPAEFANPPKSLEEQPKEIQEEPETDEPVEEPPATPQAKGWETRREGLKQAHATLQAQYTATEAKYTEAAAYNEALLQTVIELNKKLTSRESPQAAPAPEPEEELDIIDAPDKYVDRRLEKALEPYKKAMAMLLRERQESDVRGKVDHVVKGIENARLEYVKTNPGYEGRVREYADSFIDDLVFAGVSEQNAVRAFTDHLNGIVAGAMQNNRNPIEIIDRFASRYASGAYSPATQAAPPAAPTQNGNARAEVSQRIAAAVKANNSGAARQGFQPSTADMDEGPVTMQAIRSGKIRPTDVKKLLSQPHGADDFWKLARQAEEEGV